jgi:hypothetical protein
LWNSRDPDAPLHQEIGKLIAPFMPPGRRDSEEWQRELAQSELFGPLEERRFSFVEELDADQLAERIASVSFVAAAPAAPRRDLDDQLRRVAERLGGRVHFPYLSVAYVSFAV